MRTVLTAFVSAVVGGLVTALVIFGAVGGLLESVGSGVTIKEVAPSAQGSNTDQNSDPDIEGIYDRYGPGVVSLDVTTENSPAGGSGFVLDKEGHIVTNQHVVEGSRNISVEFSDGTRREAELLGQDPSTDLALLKVDAPRQLLRPLTFGDSSSAEVGDPVVAIGNPLNVGISVTRGIVSGVSRSIEAPNNYTIDGVIQTDAAVNPGNSGGPLMDGDGNVIGVTSQIASSTGSFQGIGFAVPSDTVKNVVEQLASEGEVAHAYLGVQMLPIGIEELAAYSGGSPQRFAEENNLPQNGAIVSEAVSGGPADEAGIEGGENRRLEGVPIPVPEGDVITDVEGKQVSGPEDVIAEVNARKPGDRMRLTVVSPNGSSQQVTVELDSQPQNEG